MGGALRLISLRELAGPGLDATSCGTLAELSKSDRQEIPNHNVLMRGNTDESFSMAKEWRIQT
jgi:hypothetical protein